MREAGTRQVVYDGRTGFPGGRPEFQSRNVG
jgi:hypothetical protein